MKLTLKLHQLVQAVDFAVSKDYDSSNDLDLDLEISFRELDDGIHIWRAQTPDASLRLEAKMPPLLASKLGKLEQPERPELELFEYLIC